ncbi:hypothetical protein [Thermococcus sp. 21S7]|uniref:hypothetical protein n=1 Tax=Thermococcus sp. 21S7 TaxID=1638221 RepID=UPI00143ABEAB|nr:hypothetical protein [Thermococcus sp. 21S7]NJE61172.1 hypothetical protein [Thermococcus sp. 21S7]
MSPVPPPIMRRPDRWRELTPELAERAVETVKNALPFFTAGTPIVHHTPHGIHVDVPVMYLSFAVDRVHYNPETKTPAPKGLPPESEAVEVNLEEVRERVQALLGELSVLSGAEFHAEDFWVVPVAWKSFIILHVRVSADGKEIVPDYGLTEEVRRHGS